MVMIYRHRTQFFDPRLNDHISYVPIPRNDGVYAPFLYILYIIFEWVVSLHTYGYYSLSMVP